MPSAPEVPEVKNKKLYPLLNKVSTLVIDSDTLLTTDQYAVTAVHCDNVTTAVRAFSFVITSY